MFNKRPGLSGQKAPEVKKSKSGINTKIVGTTFRKDAQTILGQFKKVGKEAFTGDDKRFSLFLRADPANAHDSRAIAVWTRSYLRGKEAQLGYIPNSGRRCPLCKLEYPATEKASQARETCERCDSKLERFGTASLLWEISTTKGMGVEDLFVVDIAWNSGGITGTENTTWGCNIHVTERENQ